MNDIFLFVLFFFKLGIAFAIVAAAFWAGVCIVYFIGKFIYNLFTSPAPDGVDELGNELEDNQTQNER